MGNSKSKASENKSEDAEEYIATLYSKFLDDEDDLISNHKIANSVRIKKTEITNDKHIKFTDLLPADDPKYAKEEIEQAYYYETNVQEPILNKNLAFNHYLIAGQKGNPQALPALERLAEELDYQKKIELSDLYRNNRFFKNHKKAQFWKQQAEESRNIGISSNNF